MKKCYFIILFIFLSVSVSSSQTIDYTQGLSIWFDTPNGLDNRAIWLRASGWGIILTKHGRTVPYQLATVVWEQIYWDLYPQNELH